MIYFSSKDLPRNSSAKICYCFYCGLEFYTTQGDPIFCRPLCKVNAFNKKKEFKEIQNLYRKCPFDPVWIHFMREKLMWRAGIPKNISNQLFFHSVQIADVKKTLNFPPLNEKSDSFVCFIVRQIIILDEKYSKKYAFNISVGYNQFFEDRKQNRMKNLKKRKNREFDYCN